MKKLQFGKALTADFMENTLTFEMEEETVEICAGQYAIIKIDTLEQKIKLEEFIDKINK